MAAAAANQTVTVVSNMSREECLIVNRWLVDHYLHLAIQAFKDNQYDTFCTIRDVLDGVLSMPVEVTDVMTTKIRVLQFLARINDGDKLDVSFEADESITPLESAMELLKTISTEHNIEQQDFEPVHTSVREMMVVVFIKNRRYDEAKTVLHKHFPKQMVGKKAILTALANDQKKTHKVLEQTSYQQFRHEMLQFCESLYPPSVPFLQKAAKKMINQRHLGEDTAQAAEQDSPAQSPLQSVPCPRQETRGEVEADSQETIDSQDEETHICQDLSMEWSPVAHRSTHGHQRPQTSNASQLEGNAPTDNVPIPRSRLEAAYFTLTEGCEISFDQLDDSPLESRLVIDKTPVTQDPTPEPTTTGIAAEPPGEADAPVKALFTVARLVTLTDSMESTEEVETEGPKTRAEVEPENMEMRLGVEADNQEMILSQEETQGTTEEPAQSTAMNQNPKSPVIHGGNVTSAQASNSNQNLAELAQSSAGRSVPARESPLRKRPASSTVNESSEASAEDIENPLSSAPANELPKWRHRKRAVQLDSDDSDSVVDSSSDHPVYHTPHKSATPHKSTTTPHKSTTTPHKSATPQKSSTPSTKSNPPANFSPPTTSNLPANYTPPANSKYSKWRQLCNNAKETKEVWSDEEDLFAFNDKAKRQSDAVSICSTSTGKRKWTDAESSLLKDAVAKFGEGNWSKMLSYYKFEDRTNVHLKDRWRTMKKLKLV